MICWRVGLERKPQHTERKSEHGKSKQCFGDADGEGKRQKRCCDQQEPTASNVASNRAGFNCARCCYEDPGHPEQGDARAYDKAENLCKSEGFQFGYLTPELSGAGGVRLE